MKRILATILLCLTTPAHGAQESMVARIRFEDAVSVSKEKVTPPPRQAVQVAKEGNGITVVCE